jgi:putative CocE/NonD family hydrolase
MGYILGHRWIQRRITTYFFKNEEKMPKNKNMHPEESWMRDFAKLAFDQPYDNAYYRDKSAWPVLDRIQIPVCLGTNWENIGLHMKGAFQAWHHIRAPKKLFIGPPDPRWPWANYQKELVAWYDYYLKGLDTGVEDQPAVRYWLQGANRWKTASDWPVPGTVTQRLYLQTVSGNNLEKQLLVSQTPEQETALSFVAIPRGMNYPQELEKNEAQWLTYQTKPYEKDTELVGPVHLHLTLASTAIDTHVIARISDVSPEGSARLLSFGWLQASHRKVDADLSRPDEIIHAHQSSEPLHPGHPEVLHFSLTPTANLFRAGHSLRLEIGSRPDLMKATVFDEMVFFPYEAPLYPARNTITHGGERPSHLEVSLRE